MPKRKYSPGMIILSYLLSLFIITAPVYLFIFRPKPIDFEIRRAKPEWTGIITLWDFPRFDSKKGTNFGWMYERISQFEKKYPGVYIEFTPLTAEKGKTKLEAAILNGGLPDIIPVGNDVSIITKNLLEPLNNYISPQELNVFSPSIINAFTYNKQIFAIPWMITPYTLILNLDLFRERGVEPPKDGYWTYEEFVEKLQILTFDSRVRGKNDHFGIDGIIGPGYYNMWGIILSDGAEIIDTNNNYAFNDSKAISGVQKLIDLKLKYNITPDNFGQKGVNQAWLSFHRDQNIGVFPVGSWGVKALDRVKAQGDGFEYTIAGFPIGNSGYPITLANEIAAFGIRDQDNKEKLKMCVEFLRFIADDKYQAELHRLGAFPVKKSISNIYESQSHMARLQESTQNIIIFSPHPLWTEIDKILQTEIMEGLLGRKNAEQIIRDAEIQVKRLLDNFNPN